MVTRILSLKPCAHGVSPGAETAGRRAPAKRSKDGLLGVGLIMAVLLMLRSRSVAGVALAWLGGEVLVVLACLAAMLLRIGRRLALAGDVRPVVVGIVPVQLQPGFGLGIGVGHDGLGRALRLADAAVDALVGRSEEHTSELQSLMRISY